MPRDSGRISGNLHRPRRFNRRLLRTCYLAALSSLKNSAASRAFYDRKRAEGKSHKQALIAQKLMTNSRKDIVGFIPPISAAGFQPNAPIFHAKAQTNPDPFIPGRRTDAESLASRIQRIPSAPHALAPVFDRFCRGLPSLWVVAHAPDVYWCGILLRSGF